MIAVGSLSKSMRSGLLAAFAMASAFPAAGRAVAAEVPACFEEPAGEAAVVAEAIDGDTVGLADGRVIRLAGVEAPKRPLSVADAAPWPPADRAREALADRVQSRSVSLHLLDGDPDRHARHHGRLLTPHDGGWVERDLVAEGWARARYLSGESGCFLELLAAETGAREAAIGLWASPEYAVRSSDDPSLPSRNGLYELVEGRVISVGRGSFMIFLDFGHNVRTDFSVMLTPEVAEGLAVAGHVPEALAGRRVRVRGLIEDSGGPAIRLNNPAELEVID
jgi:micrococcal nuclease